MKARKKNFFLSIVILALAVGTALAVLRGKSTLFPLAQEDVDQGEVPIADYESPPPSDPQQRAKRLARGRRYNMKSAKDDARRFAITEDRDSSFGGFPSHAPSEPALPAAQSDAVIVGDVTDAKAFLSEDKTDIYSEFSIQVVEVLKNSTPGSLTSGASVSATRFGGAVRFPSGKVIRTGFRGKPLPRTGRRYVFFLKFDNEGQDFSVLTAYELRGGRVVPLDGLLNNGNVVEQLAAHQSYRDTDETSFLNKVREAIQASSGTL